MATEDLSAFYDTVDGDAEVVSVQGADVAGIFSTATDVVLGEVLLSAPSIRCPANVVAAEGGAVTVRGTAYVIRQVQRLPPDGAEQLLVLAEA